MGQRTARIVRDGKMGDEPRVAGRRITVLDIYEQVEGLDFDPRSVADRYDLDIATVYHALAYYHDHPKEMAAVRDRREDVIEEHRDRSTTPDELES